MLNYAEIYSELHAENQLTFAGATCVQYADDIAKLVRAYAPKAILDYGSGKGVQYLRHRIHERWGGLLPQCYDPGVPYLSKQPKGPYQGIICCDVLEHIHEDDLPQFLQRLFGYADDPAFAFLSIACRPAKRQLRDGRNAHLTIRCPEWWDELVARYTPRGLVVQAAYDTTGGED